MKKILFICSQNKLRSPTAENIFKNYDKIEVKSAGLDNDATKKITPNDIIWSDIIFVMEKNHKNRLQKKFKEFTKNINIYVLNIQDEYDYMDEELVNTLKKRISNFINL